MRDIKLVCKVVTPDGLDMCGELHCNDWAFAAFVAAGMAAKMCNGDTKVNVNYSDTTLKIFVVEPMELPDDVDHGIFCDVVAMNFNEVVFDFIEDYDAKATVIDLG